MSFVFVERRIEISFLFKKVYKQYLFSSHKFRKARNDGRNEKLVLNHYCFGVFKLKKSLLKLFENEFV